MGGDPPNILNNLGAICFETNVSKSVFRVELCNIPFCKKKGGGQEGEDTPSQPLVSQNVTLFGNVIS